MLAPVLAFSTLLQTGSSPDITTHGSWLFNACKGAIRWMDAPDEAKPDTENENFANCTAYIRGFFEAEELMTKCSIPDDVTLGTLVRVYVHYMDQNPQLLDKHRSLGLQGAYITTYSCNARSRVPRK